MKSKIGMVKRAKAHGLKVDVVDYVPEPKVKKVKAPTAPKATSKARKPAAKPLDKVAELSDNSVLWEHADAMRAPFDD